MTTVHVLLPPSEAKSRGGRGRPLRRRTDTGPLGPARATTMAALLELGAGDPARAAQALLLPPGVAAAALADNAAVLDTPTAPALRRYTGTVYEGLAHATLTPAEQRVAARCVLIFSGLFGVLRGDEPVPAYRVPAKSVLPGLGVVATFWRPLLTAVLPAVLRPRGLVVDLRSGDYAAMWRPDRASADRLLPVRVLSPLPRGGYGIVSYSSKLGKGRLTAALIRQAAAGRPATSAADVITAWTSCGGLDAQFEDGRLDLYTSA